MKRYFNLLFALCLALTGCIQKEDVKGKFDVSGVIIEIDKERNRILVDDRTGSVWITLPEHGKIKSYREGDEVVVWVDGEIAESSPAKAKALNVEFKTPKQ